VGAIGDKKAKSVVLDRALGQLATYIFHTKAGKITIIQATGASFLSARFTSSFVKAPNDFSSQGQRDTGKVIHVIAVSATDNTRLFIYAQVALAGNRSIDAQLRQIYSTIRSAKIRAGGPRS
jgi:hypothetical protein